MMAQGNIEQTIINKQKVQIQMQSQIEFEELKHKHIMEEIQEMGKYKVKRLSR